MGVQDRPLKLCPVSYQQTNFICKIIPSASDRNMTNYDNFTLDEYLLVLYFQLILQSRKRLPSRQIDQENYLGPVMEGKKK